MVSLKNENNKQLEKDLNSHYKEEKNIYSNPRSQKIQNIYDLFYKENNPEKKTDILQKEEFNLNNFNRPNSMKESYNILKENEKNIKNVQINPRNNENKKRFEMAGQQILQQINPLPQENNKNSNNFNLDNLKEEKKAPTFIRDEIKAKNTYDNFNQKLEHLDKLKKKFEIHQNFEDKKLISRYSEPIYAYNDDLDKYKKALERRVIASKNLVFLFKIIINSFFFREEKKN